MQSPLLTAFEAGTLNPQTFDHRAHLEVAWTLLGPQGAGFACSYRRLRAGLMELCAVAGKPDRYHETRTLGWLALVHEAMTRHPAPDFDGFARAAGPAIDRSALDRRYGALLSHPAARSGLVLPGAPL